MTKYDRSCDRTPNPTATKRKLRFPAKVDELEQILTRVRNLSEISREERRTLWYNSLDFDFFKQTARAISKETRRCGGGDLLDYPDEANLKKWACFGHSRRGLERWCNKQHGNERRRAAQASIEAVLQAQDTMKRQDGQATVERLSEIYSMFTQEATDLAQHMGTADEHAVAREKSAYQRRLLMMRSSNNNNRATQTAESQKNYLAPKVRHCSSAYNAMPAAA
mmetsp:Transcript_23645/g.33186  ORF Transcript_23645/g.33186 Transcript_23645/m.33186 type:complete len:223 (+) Transcript_23645:75-743(+)